MTDRELMQDALDAILAAIKAGDWKVDGACDPDMVIERLRARLAQPEPEPVATLFGSLPVYDVPQKQEPVAWRTFDGENGYEYRDYETNESYASEWAQRNPNHKGWVEPLYKDPTPCQTCESLARTVMMDQVSHDTPPRHREPPTLDLSAPLTLNGVPMYPQREWQGLTRDEVSQIWSIIESEGDVMHEVQKFARAIEAKLKAKNV